MSGGGRGSHGTERTLFGGEGDGPLTLLVLLVRVLPEEEEEVDGSGVACLGSLAQWRGVAPVGMIGTALLATEEGPFRFSEVIEHVCKRRTDQTDRPW